MTKKPSALHVPLNIVGNRLTVRLGKVPGAGGIHVDNTETEWLAPFLEEFELSNAENPLSGSLHITYEGGLFRVTGEVEFEPMLECVRSLTHFRKPITATVNGVFLNQKSTKIESHSSHLVEKELNEFDMEVYYHDGLALDLNEIILDSLRLALPDFPLCQEDCKGICFECGCVLNGRTQCGWDGRGEIERRNTSCPSFSQLCH